VYLLLDMLHMLYLVLQDGKTALMGACAGGHLSVAQYLLNRGADINAKDNVSYDLSSFNSEDAP
jgi:ankyrin repeat protein